MGEEAFHDSDSAQLDFPKLMSRTQQVVYQVHEKKQLLRHLETSGVTVYDRAGSAWFIDPHVICIGDQIYLEADKYILCVGGHARQLNFPGAEYALTHSDIWHLRNLPRSMVIVGASAAGCQLATIFDTFGTKVTILDLAPRILPLEDESVSAAMAQAFAARFAKHELVTRPFPRQHRFAGMPDVAQPD